MRLVQFQTGEGERWINPDNVIALGRSAMAGTNVWSVGSINHHIQSPIEEVVARLTEEQF